ncbi:MULTISPECIES: glycerophosphodiester phosphodiesterase family protein [unclassified Beijerinckia]|uniref:glycerophosphodiester phosphodiesterase family protein n=1 Tax=unclassified Beijerinckia TaxID=2638183 RepID=UPI00089BD2C1|nr:MULTISPECIES: glycerophosphodiester phosphodiesterase family protein [unclassified Beijerinckia]MDH7794517.1 glycerophosphoryl diester phosphodiesterase [Beijerinckia sp. GAS462]SEB65033.1 Glycerophosphoryl diester phosphodiesterase [Beijerinckia sp. 28-YEA-48]
MPRPSWLVAHPIAHRGLHDRTAGVIENSLSAARRAVAGGYAMECDVQLTADGEAVVFHDFTLDRLIGRAGRVIETPSVELTQMHLRGSADTVPTLAALLDVMGAGNTLVVEIKSAFDGDMRLAERTARIVARHGGQVALKSFDPQVMTHLRVNRAALGITDVPLGMIAEAHYDDAEWAFLTDADKQALANFLHWDATQPDFLSYYVNDFPHAVPHLLRRALGLPVMTWTVRTTAQKQAAAQWADQIVFEGNIA